MNILVTGANGQLGNELRIVSRESADRYIFTDVIEQEGAETTILDITNLDAIRALVRAAQTGLYGISIGLHKRPQGFERKRR